MNSSDVHLSERLIEIESKLVHQEDLLEKLNRIVTEQELTIFKLEEALASLAQRFQEVVAEGPRPHNEKPPHY